MAKMTRVEWCEVVGYSLLLFVFAVVVYHLQTQPVV